METTSLADLKAHLSDYADRAEHQHDRFVITRNGRPSFAVIGADDLASLEETVFWLSQPGIREDVAEARSDAAQGDVFTNKEDLMRHLGLA